jgi:hypothetical protein
MGVRNNTQLAADFPKTTSALLQQSNQKFDYLINDGFLGDYGDYSSIQGWLGPAMNALAETFAIATPTFTGTAGTTTRYYGILPAYPLEFPSGGAQNVDGNYLNFLGGKPPYGFPAASPSGAAYDGARYLWGIASALEEVVDTAAVLTAANYVSIVLPAAQHITGVTFDIFQTPAATGDPYTLVARNVAPGTTYEDKGPLAAGADPLYGAVYTPPAYAQVGIDTTVTPAPGLVVYGWLTRFPTT